MEWERADRAALPHARSTSRQTSCLNEREKAHVSFNFAPTGSIVVGVAASFAVINVCQGKMLSHADEPAIAPTALPLGPMERQRRERTPTRMLHLDHLPASPNIATGAAVVVCPGGGHGMLAVDHEGKQVAERLNSLGVAALILKYRLGSHYHHPAMLDDAGRAIRTVRAGANR